MAGIGVINSFKYKGGSTILSRANPPVNNNPPVWDSQPSIVFIFGTSNSYDMDDISSDPDADAITFSMNTGAVSLPTGVTWTAGTGVLAYDGIGAVNTTTGHIITLDDGTDTTDSNAFNISIASTGIYPLTATARGGSLNMYQDSAIAATDRAAIGSMDACHVIGFDSGTQADTDPPATGYISRTQGNQEILDGSLNNTHYLCTYHNITEAFADGSATTSRAIFIRDYIDSLDGPGTDDGWAYNSANEKVLFFGNQYTINISDYVAKKDGLTYPEWYADNLVQPYYIDVHAAAGVKIGGPGGVNIMLDNFQHHSNKSGIDWNNDGSNNDAQDYYDSEEASHVSADATAVTAYSAVRTNMMAGKNRFISNNPGTDMFVLTNTNQWADDPADRSVPTDPANLRNCILEYRLDSDPEQADIHGGFSEGNSTNSFPRSGVNSDGTNSGQAGAWEKTYTNTYQSVRLSQPPSIIFCSFWVQCLQSGTNGPGGKTNWPNVPASNSVWHMARWAMVTAWLAGAHATITGIQVGASTAGRAQSTPIFDEYGLINTSTTKLFHNWMGNPVDVPPTAAKTDGHWGREFDNAYIGLNPDNNEANAAITIDVSALPGGATKWKRFNGFQDSTTNDGTDASSDFDLDPIDAFIFVDKTWYDAL